jgi:DNA polymerase-3 subunit alpha
MSKLVHLHRHSEFSLLDGVGTAEVYAARAAELGQVALAITDHGNLAGTLYHAQACEEVGIKPILGIEAYFRQDIASDRENKNPFGYFHLILLAKNEEGWKNLMRLSSISFQEENFYQKPCLDWRTLRKYSDGIIASTACAGGIIPQSLIRDDEKQARKLLTVFRDIFKENFYLEIQPHDFIEQSIINLMLCNWANEYGIPVVATGDVHFPYQDWYDTQGVLIKTKIGNEKELDVPETCWLMDENELAALFQKHHSEIPFHYVMEAIESSYLIAEEIEHFQIDKSPKIPKATKSLLEAEGVLRKWCQEGLERIGKIYDQEYLDRMNEEFDVLRKLKVLDYFVIVGDVVRWAKDNGIRVGPGRGSAAGCLINYLIRITAIDPIGYGLLFERFMNEYRTEIPDIDLDFQDDRRDEVKDYLKKKWGDEYVVDVASFQSFGLKAAIKDVGRVLSVPYEKLTRATESIPDKTWGMSLDDLEEQLPKVKSVFDEYPELKKHANRLQGQVKGQSRHAGAVIVTDRPARDVIPMMRAKDGGTVTQWSERANAQLISPYGFLKIDCLSTDGLTVQDKTIKLIKERHGIDINFEDIEQFPVIESPEYAEQDIVEAFSDGANLGVFQFGKIKRFLKELKPTSLEHLIAANAMNRPGPMALIDDYTARKNGAEWSLVHDCLEPYMAYTYGIIVFQEQVMQAYKALGKDVASGDSATFLKVVAKGIARDLEGKERLQKYFEKFAAGCEEKGIPKSAYEKVWNQILEMTTYSFNKSHSTGYAVQAYQDKWLQRRYPLEFYASFLTVDSDKPKKIPSILKESRQLGIVTLPPDVNISDVGFTIDVNNIRFGLLAIKNVGDSAIKVIKENRLYESYEDFCKRVPKAKANKKVKKALFESGSFDSLGGRNDWVIDDEANRIEGSIEDREKAKLEMETIGYALSRKSDIDAFKKLIKERTLSVLELEQLDNSEVMLGGEIMAVKEHESKNGKMGFVDLSFESDDYSLTFFSENYSKYQHLLGEGNAILVIGDWDKERQATVVKNVCTAAQLAEDLKREKV